MQTIQKEAQKINKQVSILIQLQVTKEKTKYGLNPNEADVLLEHYFHAKAKYSHLFIKGIMGMASNTKDEMLIEKEFNQLHSLFISYKNTFFLFNTSFTELSMGMSTDYKIALKNGATLVRIGSRLFGNRG